MSSGSSVARQGLTIGAERHQRPPALGIDGGAIDHGRRQQTEAAADQPTAPRLGIGSVLHHQRLKASSTEKWQVRGNGPSFISAPSLPGFRERKRTLCRTQHGVVPVRYTKPSDQTIAGISPSDAQRSVKQPNHTAWKPSARNRPAGSKAARDTLSDGIGSGSGRARRGEVYTHGLSCTSIVSRRGEIATTDPERLAPAAPSRPSRHGAPHAHRPRRVGCRCWPPAELHRSWASPRSTNSRRDPAAANRPSGSRHPRPCRR